MADGDSITEGLPPGNPPQGEAPVVDAPPLETPAAGELGDLSELEALSALPTEQEPAPVATDTGGGKVLDAGKIQGIRVRVQGVLGGISLTIAQLSSLKEGDTISLDTKIGDPIDITANGQVIAQGQIEVVEGDAPAFAIRIIELVEGQ